MLLTTTAWLLKYTWIQIYTFIRGISIDFDKLFLIVKWRKENRGRSKVKIFWTGQKDANKEITIKMLRRSALEKTKKRTV